MNLPQSVIAASALALLLAAVLISLYIALPEPEPVATERLEAPADDTPDTAAREAAEAEAEEQAAAEAEQAALKAAEAEAGRLAQEAAEAAEAEREPVAAPPSASEYEDASWFRSQGVTQYGGWRVSWYNPERLGTSHAALGLRTVGAPITDRGDGIGVVGSLVAVALPSGYAYGTEVDSPFGRGVVVDHSVSAMDICTFW